MHVKPLWPDGISIQARVRFGIQNYHAASSLAKHRKRRNKDSSQSLVDLMSRAARQSSELWSESWDGSDPRAARQAIRSGAYTGYTAGIAPGFV